MAATKEVVVSPGVAIEVAGDAWDEADWTPDEVVGVAPQFPEIKLIQKAVPDIPDSGKHSGEFWLSDRGEFVPFLEGVFISVASTRVAFDERNRDQPVCASDDGLVPRPNMPLWSQADFQTKDGTLPVKHGQPSNCATCQFGPNAWGEDERGNRIPPPCREGYTALFEEAETLNLYRMRFKGTAIKGLRSLLNSLAGAAMRRGAKRRGRPIYSKRVTVGSAEGKRDSFLWYYPEITVEGDVDPALAREYIALADELRPGFRKAVAATHADDEAQEAAVVADDGWNDA